MLSFNMCYIVLVAVVVVVAVTAAVVIVVVAAVGTSDIMIKHVLNSNNSNT